METVAVTGDKKSPLKQSADGYLIINLNGIDLSAGSVPVSLNAADIQIGAVEIKDGSSDLRAIVDSNGALKVTGGGGVPNAEYKSPSDFTATYTSNVTITLSSLPVTISDSSQIVYVKVVPSSGSASYYTNGQDGVTMNISSNVLTISGAGTPFASGDVYEIGINAQTKAYDASTNSQMNSVLNPVWSRYTDAETLITDAQDFTSSWADIGSEIDKRGYTEVWIYGTLDINDSTDCRIRALGKIESGGTFEGNFMIETISATDVKVAGEYIEFNSDSDQSFILKIDAGAVPFIQLQVVAGTLGGGTAAQIDSLSYNMIWR